MQCFCLSYSGIGYEVAKWIAMMGGTVIIACRSEDKAMEVRTMTSQPEPRHEKPVRCFRSGPIQTGLYSHKKWLES